MANSGERDVTFLRSEVVEVSPQIAPKSSEHNQFVGQHRISGGVDPHTVSEPHHSTPHPRYPYTVDKHTHTYLNSEQDVEARESKPAEVLYRVKDS